MTAQMTLDRHTLHQMLLAVPVHVLCFDRELVCRYAAPAGGSLLGIDAFDLIGRELHRILPDAGELQPLLRLVFDTGRRQQIEHFELERQGSGAVRGDAWMLLAQPCTLGTAADAAPALGGAPGQEAAVLLTCYRCTCAHRCCPADAAHARELVPAGSAFEEGRDAEARRSAMLLERVRTKLTVIRGFAQLLRRRSHRSPASELDELERINQAAGELDDLLARYEARGWPSTNQDTPPAP
jgi:signal transduction histidine kinase